MAVARADLVGSTSTFTLCIQLKQILETQEMICYVLAMGKQRLKPHVVVGYGIKIFWPGLFITSPDHLVVFSSKVCSVTYLDFLHARTIHDGTSDISFGENYLVEFSVIHKTRFL